MWKPLYLCFLRDKDCNHLNSCLVVWLDGCAEYRAPAYEAAGSPHLINGMSGITYRLMTFLSLPGFLHLCL